MKAWLTILPLSIAAPAAVAQISSAEDERAAVLACELGGLCGGAALSEAARSKEAIEGVETRQFKTLGEKLEEQRQSQSAQSAPKQRAAVARRGTASRNAPGRRPPSLASAAAGVPDAIARRAPLLVTFELGSARLTPESRLEIKSFAKALDMLAAAGLDKRFQIEGHTDSLGSSEFNLKLSHERASAVRAALVESGVDAARIDVTGLGESRPIEGYDGRNALNRRVEAVEIK